MDLVLWPCEERTCFKQDVKTSGRWPWLTFCSMISSLIRMMSPIGSQTNLMKSFTELSFIVFSIYSKTRTSTSSSIPREAAVTCARVGSICIVTCCTAVTLVTWRTFVDIWSKKKNYSLRMFQRIQSTVGFWSFWHVGPPSAYKKASHNESPKTLAGVTSNLNRVCRESWNKSDKLLSLQELRFWNCREIQQPYIHILILWTLVLFLKL